MTDAPLVAHAVAECNAAHAALDRLGAPKARTVPNREGTAEQLVTLGLADRVEALPVRQMRKLLRDLWDDPEDCDACGDSPCAIHRNPDVTRLGWDLPPHECEGESCRVCRAAALKVKAER